MVIFLPVQIYPIQNYWPINRIIFFYHLNGFKAIYTHVSHRFIKKIPLNIIHFNFYKLENRFQYQIPTKHNHWPFTQNYYFFHHLNGFKAILMPPTDSIPKNIPSDIIHFNLHKLENRPQHQTPI